MGKKRKGSHNDAQSRKHRKRGFWINKCPESSTQQGPNSNAVALTVIITQTNLTDGHIHGVSHSKADALREQVDRRADRVSERPACADDSPVRENTEASSLRRDKGDQSATSGSTIPAEAARVDVEITEANRETRGEPSTVQISQNSGQNHNAFIRIKRAPSAKRPPVKLSKQHFVSLARGDCGDGVLNPHADVDDKYWAQRKRLFDRFDRGIQLDAESWYSVTPQAIASHIADRVVRACSGRSNLTIMDPFCGCGGNAIAFARLKEVSLVVCVDVDRAKLEMAAHNAALYDVCPTKLLFLHDNAITILDQLDPQVSLTNENAPSVLKQATKIGRYTLDAPVPKAVDCIFLSPPWGGVDYGQGNYTVKDHIQVTGTQNTIVNGQELLERASRAQKRTVYFLPRNILGRALGQSAAALGYDRIELEKNVLNEKFKTVTAYFGMPLMHEE